MSGSSMNFYQNAKEQGIPVRASSSVSIWATKQRREREQRGRKGGKDGHFVVLTKAKTAQGDGYGSDLTTDGLTLGWLVPKLLENLFPLCKICLANSHSV